MVTGSKFSVCWAMYTVTIKNQLKNEEQFESSKVINSSHAKREWEVGGGEEPWIEYVSATARLRHAFVPPGRISSSICPQSADTDADHGLLIQIAMEFLTNHEPIRWPTLDRAGLLADGSEQVAFQQGKII